MTDKINKILSDLIGLPLTRTTRAANIECLKFGSVYRTDKDGGKNNIGEFALHLTCPWRLTNETHIIVGSDDLYQQADETAEYDEDYNYHEFNANLRDVKLDKLINENKLSIVSANADKYGGLEICFDNNIKLTVFPDLTSKADNEYWRLIDFRNERSKHLESWSTGYKIE
ncbi:MAG: Uncharacterized protein JWQ09_52 [Segetibacter sp.]|nr:Uncharacterized protein [Segetibacter sp.]